MFRRCTRLAAFVALAVALAVLAGCHAAKVLIPPNLRPAENTEDARKAAIGDLRYYADARIDATAVQTVGVKKWDGFVLARVR